MKTSRIRSIRASGFTLVELLVVIAILGGVALMAMYGFNKSSQRAKAAAGLNIVRDLGTSVLAYATEKGELPVWHDYNLGCYWWELLLEFEAHDDPSRFRNPAHKGFDREDAARTISFGWNYPVIGRHKGDSGFRGDHVLRLSNFPNPSETLVLADGPGDNCWGYIDGYNNRPDPGRYGGKAAAAFLDGSARLLETPDEFLPDSKWFQPVRPLVRR